MIRRFLKSERSQAMPEFALVAPILFLIIFGIFDLGRGVVAYIGIQHAANEAARVAIQGEIEVGTVPPYLPPTSDAAAQAGIKDSGGLKLLEGGQVSGTCLNGPITTNWSGTGEGVIFITDPESVPSTGGAPANGYSGTGSDDGALAPNGCWQNWASAGGQVPIQATVVYHFSPVTPLIGNIIKAVSGNSTLTLSAWSTYVSEY